MTKENDNDHAGKDVPSVHIHHADGRVTEYRLTITTSTTRSSSDVHPAGSGISDSASEWMKMAEVLAHALYFSGNSFSDPYLKKDALEEYEEMIRKKHR